MNKVKKQLNKSKDAKIFGVLAGFAEYYDWDKTWTRIIFAVLLVLTNVFPLALIYILAALIMDNGDDIKIVDIE